MNSQDQTSGALVTTTASWLEVHYPVLCSISPSSRVPPDRGRVGGGGEGESVKNQNQLFLHRPNPWGLHGGRDLGLLTMQPPLLQCCLTLRRPINAPRRSPLRRRALKGTGEAPGISSWTINFSSRESPVWEEVKVGHSLKSYTGS